MEQIFYPTFRAECARRGLKPVDVLVDALSVSSKTAFNKVTGVTAFTLNETAAVRDKFFPGMTIDELLLPIYVSTQEGA